MNRLRLPLVGLRREVLILLPAATTLMILLGAFTLWSYRSAIHRLVDERRLEVASIAGRLAENPWQDLPRSVEALRRVAPEADYLALLAPDGSTVLATGSLGGENPLDPLRGLDFRESVTLGPDASLSDRVTSFQRVRGGSEVGFVRVDLPAAELGRQLRNLRILLGMFLPISLALAVLVLAFLRHFLTPYETLLAKARLAGESQADEDEAAFLVATVERALTKLTEVETPSPADDIAALERTLGPSLQSGLLVTGINGRVLAFNQIGAELLHLDRTENGIDYHQLLEKHPVLVEVFDSISPGDQPAKRLKVEINAPSGSRTLGLTVHPLKRDDGIVRGYLTLFVDLTENLRLADEEKLTRSLNQLGELAAGIAHELRNSLGTLRGYLTLIQRTPRENPITDYLQEIQNESDHLERVLEDFLSFARPGSKRLEQVRLVQLLLQASKDPTLRAMPVEVRCDEKGEVEIKGDKQLLERAFRNLLHNATQAEREAGGDGPILVTVRRHETGIEICIADRGPGVDPGIRDRLFQPFATSRAQGVGLGLALAHRIVSLHGGRLSLDPRAGGGTVAEISFPVEPPISTERSATALTP